MRHRSVYHHTEGAWLCQRICGTPITLSTGRMVPVRLIAERHIIEDLGWLPSPHDYIKNMSLEQWMGGRQVKEMSWEQMQPSKPQTIDTAETPHA